MGLKWDFYKIIFVFMVGFDFSWDGAGANNCLLFYAWCKKLWTDNTVPVA